MWPSGMGSFQYGNILVENWSCGKFEAWGLELKIFPSRISRRYCLKEDWMRTSKKATVNGSHEVL